MSACPAPACGLTFDAPGVLAAHLIDDHEMAATDALRASRAAFYDSVVVVRGSGPPGGKRTPPRGGRGDRRVSPDPAKPEPASPRLAPCRRPRARFRRPCARRPYERCGDAPAGRYGACRAAHVPGVRQGVPRAAWARRPPEPRAWRRPAERLPHVLARRRGPCAGVPAQAGCVGPARVDRAASGAARRDRGGAAMSGLVLSLFPGIGLLDRAFEEEPQLREMLRPWAAALIDGEGCISMAKSHQAHRPADVYYRIDVIVSNTQRALLEPMVPLLGGRIDAAKKATARRRAGFQWKTTGSAHAATVLRFVRPWLVAKGQQAEVALRACALLERKGWRRPAGHLEKLAALKVEMHRLNRRGA